MKKTAKRNGVVRKPDPLMGFRADPITRAKIVKWAENQPDQPTMSDAIRRLVGLGLSAKAHVKKASRA